MEMFFPVNTNKILLRPFELKDEQAKQQIDYDQEILKNLGRPSNLEKDIYDFERIGYGLVAIVDAETGQIVGYAKLQCPDWKTDIGLEIIVAVLSVYRRKGFAFEAAKKLIEIACGPLKQMMVVARVSRANSPSIELVKKLGMIKIDKRKDPFDDIQYNIFAIFCKSIQ